MGVRRIGNVIMTISAVLLILGVIGAILLGNFLSILGSGFGLVVGSLSVMWTVAISFLMSGFGELINRSCDTEEHLAEMSEDLHDIKMLLIQAQNTKFGKSYEQPAPPEPPKNHIEFPTEYKGDQSSPFEFKIK